MLREILDIMRKSEGTLDLRRLGRELDVEESALRGMMDYLVRRGYLKEECYSFGQGCEGCRGCGRFSGLLRSPDEEGRPIGYSLSEKAWNGDPSPLKRKR